jgi:hypothetical protein
MTELGTARAMSALRRFAVRQEAAARCDLCASALGEPHHHLLEPEKRELVCACNGCALLFPESGGGRYRHIRSRALGLRGMELGEADFRALELPVRLAFLCPSRVHGRTFAIYPNPGGTTEATVPPAAWADLLAAYPVAAGIEPDVEGLLIDHLDGRKRCFVASLDVCHYFVGLLRRESLAEAMRFIDGLDGGARG